MGELIEGRWETTPVEGQGSGGVFARRDSGYRHWVTPDGAPGPTGEGGFVAEPGRYHLYVSYACPWAHRTLILRALKGLEGAIGVSVVHPDMLDDGWTFRTDFDGATGDAVMGLPFLRDVYLRDDPRASTKVTVPVLWDRERERIVSNESADIVRMLTAAWDAVGARPLDLWPEALRAEIEPVNARVYDTLNNGVYKAGFARTQAAYDEAVVPLFETLDWLEGRLSRSRWLVGNRFTEADVRLWTTLARFDAVYHGHFKCNRRKLIELPALWAFARDVHAIPGVAATLRLDHIVRHYHYSHESLNPRRIVPLGPLLDWAEPHGRDTLGPEALPA